MKKIFLAMMLASTSFMAFADLAGNVGEKEAVAYFNENKGSFVSSVPTTFKTNTDCVGYLDCK